MSTRRQLYDLLRTMSDYDPAPRVAMLAAYFDSLPPAEIPAAERRLLAFTQAYNASVEGGLKGTLDEFIAAVDAAEQRLMN